MPVLLKPQAVDAGQHIVQFYERDEDLLAGDYLIDAARDRAVTVVIATEAHRDMFEARLRGAGVDVAAARDEGQGLYTDPAEAVIALRHDGFVAGTGKRFQPRQCNGSAASIAVQMRDAEGAEAEAKRQFRTAFAPCPGEPKCATGIERFEVPRVPGAKAAEIRHKVHGDVFDNTTIVFTKGAFVYQVFASGAGIDDRRDELIDAAQVFYERVPADGPRS